jgi:uncharacterized protein
MSNETQAMSSSDQQTASQGQLDGQKLKILIEAGLTWLKTNQELVNSLNVFPVPDGDTGTNMVLTMQAAFEEIARSEEFNIGIVAHEIAQGALLGARGNSGVILSQILRGFARTLDKMDTMSGETFVKALTEARNTAYKGVVRPVEGTILTVCSDMAIAAQEALKETGELKQILAKVIDAANDSVEHTPELLPILKQAGVVDSGGKGLFFIIEGMQRYLNGEDLCSPLAQVKPLSVMQMEHTMEAVEPGQDFEIVLDFTPYEDLNLEKFYDDLSEMGSSIQLGEGDGMYRMHIHVPTEKRYAPIDYTMEIGLIQKITIENLLAMVNEIPTGPQPIELKPFEPGQIAVAIVSPGPGLSRIFASLGIAAVVEGGQTMNPSAQEIMESFEELPTENVIILPNNKNIIMAAQSASKLSSKKVVVIPSVNIPGGLSAMLRYMPNGDYDQMVEAMNEALTEVDTGEITTATRTAEINGVNVKKGEIIALFNGKLVQSSKSLDKTVMKLLEVASTDEKERVTLFYGDNISRGEVDQIADQIQVSYPEHEIEIHEGGQPFYQFIIAIE